MKTDAALFVLLAAGLLIASACKTAENERSIPGRLDIPADFSPGKEDFTYAGKNGKFMGMRKFRGRDLRRMNGVYPIYVVMTRKGRFDRNPIQVGDIIIGVNGKPLGKDPVYQFKSTVGRTAADTGLLTVSRWRAGEIATFTLDLNSHAPDFTKGGEASALHDWQLGPTGMNGWVYSANMNKGASREARQILVTLVEAGSPADGKILRNDVILGVDGTTFAYDARKAFAAAIVAAETEDSNGELNLLIWRDGKEMEIILKLKTLPDPSATSPYDCAKTDRIVDAAVQHILANRETLLKPEGWINYINGLGLLATGREDVMPVVKKLAHGSMLEEGETISIQKHRSMMCWWWSYKTIFLCEYYLRTSDAAVLPTIEEYATKIAMGQSGVGTWGHTYAAIENAGRLHGHLGGYGAINQQGLTLMIALPLAWKCGIRNDEVRDAIKRGETFFTYYIDKGAIPYGDHAPNTLWFDDNGKSGSAAIMFDLIDNQKGTSFYSSMVLGSAPTGREAGHTGCFWSHLWGGIGAARSGRRGMTAFMQEMDWAFTLERHWQGRLVFQGNAGEDGDQGKPKKKWDCSGARLLQLCVPRNHLYITGRDMKVDRPLQADRIAFLLKAGALYSDKDARKDLSRDEIMVLLRDELPAVRMIAARAIKAQKLQMVDELVAMLDSENRYEQYGACYALRESGYGSTKAVEKLIQLIETSDDLDLRLNALDALTGSDPETTLASASKAAIPALLRLAVKRFEIDPRRLLQRRLAFALFDRFGLITLHGIDDLDSTILVPAVRELLTVDDGRARGLVGRVFAKLKEEDRKALWKDIYLATRDLAPSGIMFADQVRGAGLNLMMSHRVEEGVDLTLSFMQEDRWGAGGREKTGIDILKGYGTSAEKALPYLRELREKWSRKKTSEEQMAKLDAAIKAIESGEPVELKSIAAYIE